MMKTCEWMKSGPPNDLFSLGEAQRKLPHSDSLRAMGKSAGGCLYNLLSKEGKYIYQVEILYPGIWEYVSLLIS